VWYNISRQRKKDNKERTIAMRRSNPEGTHSFYDLDDTWYKYLKADKEGRRKMCDEVLEAEAICYGLGMLAVLIGIIVALCKGWI
jgi:hypothetical protein